MLCSALGVVLRLLLYEHRRSIAYPAATVQAGNPQGNQAVPSLQTTRAEQEVMTRFLQDYDSFYNREGQISKNSCFFLKEKNFNLLQLHNLTVLVWITTYFKQRHWWQCLCLC